MEQHNNIFQSRKNVHIILYDFFKHANIF